MRQIEEAGVIGTEECSWFEWANWFLGQMQLTRFVRLQFARLEMIKKVAKENTSIPTTAMLASDKFLLQTTF